MKYTKKLLDLIKKLKYTYPEERKSVMLFATPSVIQQYHNLTASEIKELEEKA